MHERAARHADRPRCAPASHRRGAPGRTRRPCWRATPAADRTREERHHVVLREADCWAGRRRPRARHSVVDVARRAVIDRELVRGAGLVAGTTASPGAGAQRRAAPAAIRASASTRRPSGARDRRLAFERTPFFHDSLDRDPRRVRGGLTDRIRKPGLAGSSTWSERRESSPPHRSWVLDGAAPSEGSGGPASMRATSLPRIPARPRSVVVPGRARATMESPERTAVRRDRRAASIPRETTSKLYCVRRRRQPPGRGRSSWRRTGQSPDAGQPCGAADDPRRTPRSRCRTCST